MKRHFSELTEDEVHDMCLRCTDALITYAKGVNMSGLSHAGSHDLYEAVQNAIFGQWAQSRKVMGVINANE